MKDQGYGAGYAYDHDAEDGFPGQNYFPDGMKRPVFYQPVERGFERELKKRVDWFAKLRAKRQGGAIGRAQLDIGQRRRDRPAMTHISPGGPRRRIGAMSRYLTGIARPADRARLSLGTLMVNISARSSWA